MKKLTLAVIFSLMLLATTNAHARNSAAAYDAKFYSQQEYVDFYNNSTGTFVRDYIVNLDATGATVNPNNNLGQYVLQNNCSVNDNVYQVGVVDESIAPGTVGRVCIRGPHKVVLQTGNTGHGIGTLMSQCPSNIWNGGYACVYGTSTGTVGGSIGYVIQNTLTTDTGDAANTVWIWVAPQIQR